MILKVKDIEEHISLRDEITAKKFGIIDRLNKLDSELKLVKGIVETGYDLDSYNSDIPYLIFIPKYDIDVKSDTYFDDRRNQLKEIIRILNKYGFQRTEDRIEDYGEHWYIVTEDTLYNKINEESTIKEAFAFNNDDIKHIVDELEKSPCVSKVHENDGVITIQGAWRSTPRKAHKDYVDIKILLNKLDVSTDWGALVFEEMSTRDDNSEFSCKLRIDMIDAKRISREKPQIKESHSLKEEKGPFFGEWYLAEIGNELEKGNEFGDVDGVNWEVTINGLTSEDFQSDSLYEYLLEEISHPVRDGHLGYNGLDVILYKEGLLASNDEKTLYEVGEDLRILFDIDKEEIDAWVNSTDDDAYIEFWIDYDVDVDTDSLENLNDTDLDESKEFPTDEEVEEESKTELNRGSAKEMSNVIYDTLFGNTQYPQFDFEKSENHEVDANKKHIIFDYMGHTYKLSIEEIFNYFENLHLDDSGESLYSVSFKKDGVYQANLIHANDEKDAEQRFKVKKPDAEFIGVSKATKSDIDKGKPVVESATTGDIKEKEEHHFYTITVFETATKPGHTLNTEFDLVADALQCADDKYMGAETIVVRENHRGIGGESSGPVYIRGKNFEWRVAETVNEPFKSELQKDLKKYSKTSECLEESGSVKVIGVVYEDKNGEQKEDLFPLDRRYGEISLGNKMLITAIKSYFSDAENIIDLQENLIKCENLTLADKETFIKHANDFIDKFLTTDDLDGLAKEVITVKIGNRSIDLPLDADSYNQIMLSIDEIDKVNKGEMSQTTGNTRVQLEDILSQTDNLSESDERSLKTAIKTLERLDLKENLKDVCIKKFIDCCEGTEIESIQDLIDVCDTPECVVGYYYKNFDRDAFDTFKYDLNVSEFSTVDTDDVLDIFSKIEFLHEQLREESKEELIDDIELKMFRTPSEFCVELDAEAKYKGHEIKINLTDCVDDDKFEMLAIVDKEVPYIKGYEENVRKMSMEDLKSHIIGLVKEAVEFVETKNVELDVGDLLKRENELEDREKVKISTTKYGDSFEFEDKDEEIMKEEKVVYSNKEPWTAISIGEEITYHVKPFTHDENLVTLEHEFGDEIRILKGDLYDNYYLYDIDGKLIHEPNILNPDYED